MKSLLVLFPVVLAAPLFLPFTTGKKNVVCYFSSWAVYRQGNGKFDVTNIDPNLCTHINFAFLGVTDEGHIQILDGWESDDDGLKGFQHLAALKNVSDVKVMASMGGWNEGSTKYSDVAKDPVKRKTLVQDILTFLQTHNFDGFDLDWEYPTKREDSEHEEDKENYVILLKELKTILYPYGYLLSAAVSGGVYTARDAYDVPAVSAVLDIINVMTYDYHGHFEPYVGHVSPLYASSLDTGDENKTLNVASGIEFWLDNGADPAKMNLGIVTYGRSFTLADESNTQLYAPTIGGGSAGPYTAQEGFLGYNEICELHLDWEYVWDDEQKVPHRISGNQWVGFEDVDSIKEKAEYANSKSLGGMMIWAFDTDDFNGICGDVYPLIGAVNEYLNA